jgi:hypothetical protein
MWKPVESLWRVAPQATFFLERSDNVIARRCLRNFSVLFLLDMRPSNGVFMWYLWHCGYTWDHVRGCVWKNIFFSKHQKKHYF